MEPAHLKVPAHPSEPGHHQVTGRGDPNPPESARARALFRIL
jgi:hypothetical protein